MMNSHGCAAKAVQKEAAAAQAAAAKAVEAVAEAAAAAEKENSEGIMIGVWKEALA